MSFRRLYFDEMGIQERIEECGSVCFLSDVYLNFSNFSNVLDGQDAMSFVNFIVNVRFEVFMVTEKVTLV